MQKLGVDRSNFGILFADMRRKLERRAGAGAASEDRGRDCLQTGSDIDAADPIAADVVQRLSRGTAFLLKHSELCVAIGYFDVRMQHRLALDARGS